MSPIMDLFLLMFSICDHKICDVRGEILCAVKEVVWLEDRLRDFQIVNLVKAVNVWVHSAFGNASL